MQTKIWFENPSPILAVKTTTKNKIINKKIKNFIWVMLTLIGSLFLANGLVQLPFYMISEEPILSGLRFITLFLSGLGGLMLYFGVIRLSRIK